MQIIERTICYLANKIFKYIDIDEERKVDIVYTTIGLIGFLLAETVIIFAGYKLGRLIVSLIFTVAFGLVRKGAGEHYPYSLQCILGTSSVFICFIISEQNINISQSILFTLVGSILIGLLFRRWGD